MGRTSIMGKVMFFILGVTILAKLRAAGHDDFPSVNAFHSSTNWDSRGFGTHVRSGWVHPQLPDAVLVFVCWIERPSSSASIWVSLEDLPRARDLFQHSPRFRINVIITIPISAGGRYSFRKLKWLCSWSHPCLVTLLQCNTTIVTLFNKQNNWAVGIMCKKSGSERTQTLQLVTTNS